MSSSLPTAKRFRHKRVALSAHLAAVQSGTALAFSRFTRTTFAAFGIAILPFFVFDWWFTAVVPLFNELILLDALGNAIYIAVCARGYFILGERTLRTRATTMSGR